LRSPLVAAYWSFALPGFGNLLQKRYATGFLLLLWEIFINNKAHLNMGILYTLTGQFEKSKEILEFRWLLLYVAIYMFALWDSYRGTVDLNKLALLAVPEETIQNMKISVWEINYLDKKKPILAILWSVLAPGLGQLYIHSVIAGIYVFIWWIIIMFYSHIPEAIYYTMMGQWEKVHEVINMQWMMYFPSLYFFVIYDAYVSAVETNKMFDKEQKLFLQKAYQSSEFEFPI
jgi:hypothetical protein